MAQAVMAQAFSRTETLTGDPSDTETARAAFRAIPRALVRQLPSGPWIRLYSFDGTPVLNAQLQSAISVGDYATATGDPEAAARGLPFDVLIGADHARGSALDAVLVADDDLLLRLVPVVDLGGADLGARLVLALL